MGVWEAVLAALSDNLEENAAHSIDSTIVEDHAQAAGAKGRLKKRRLVVRGEGSPQNLGQSLCRRTDMGEILQIRESDDSDRDFVVNSLIKLQNHEVSLHDSRQIGDRKLCESYFKEILTKSYNCDGALLVACMNELPVGFICFWLENNSCLNETEDSNRCGYISDVFVSDEYRRSGVARRMFDEVQSRLRKNPLTKRLRICSLAANMLAIAAYEGSGFQPYEILYEKILR